MPRPTPAFTVTERLTGPQVAELTALLAGQWWSLGRDVAGIERMLSGSTVAVTLTDPDTGRVLAFGRALSDGVYRAHVYDVVVADGEREGGLGRAVMEALLEHPALAGVELVQLDCLPELGAFYGRWGFAPLVSGARTLARTEP